MQGLWRETRHIWNQYKSAFSNLQRIVLNKTPHIKELLNLLNGVKGELWNAIDSNFVLSIDGFSSYDK